MKDDTTDPYRPRRIGQVWIRREADEAAIYDPVNQALHVLNPSALAIWELCDGETTVEEMAEAVSELTDTSLAAASRDIEAVISDLTRLNLLEC